MRRVNAFGRICLCLCVCLSFSYRTLRFDRRDPKTLFLVCGCIFRMPTSSSYVKVKVKVKVKGAKTGYTYIGLRGRPPIAP